MATSEDLLRLNAHLRPLAGIIHATAAAEGRPWVAAALDAHFDGAGGFINKIRVERADGSTGSPTMPVEGTLELIALGHDRSTGEDRWHGLVLRVTTEGACEIQFNYDPACAGDVAFFES